MAEKPKRGLGRGLSSLMADIAPEGDRTDGAPRRPDLRIPVEMIRPNPNQPRRSFDTEALNELAASIAEKGVIQPLIVRPAPDRPSEYEIVAGERRWRAAQIVQLHEVPALVRDYTDTEVLEVAIIENIQRADLNPIDEASGYRQLMDRFGHTQEQLAKALGKSRSHIANQMRLLGLPDEIQTYLVNGDLTAGHARALIGHPSAIDLARQIVSKRLSVREAERLTRKPAAKARNQAARPEKDADTRQIEGELSAILRMRVTLDPGPAGDGGRLTIRYRDLDQLDDLLRLLSGS